MAERKQEWAVRLAQALRKWCDEHGYTPRNRLGTQLEIPQALWRHIIAGNTISGDLTVYARIFERTQLPQAHPCSIPPRVVKIPSGASMKLERAWTEEQWHEWLRKNRPETQEPQLGRVAQKAQEAVSMARFHKEVKEEMAKEEPGPSVTVGNIVDGFIAALGRQLGTAIAEAIAEEVANRVEGRLTAIPRNQPSAVAEERGVSPKGSTDIGTLIQRLLQKLREASGATPEEQDELSHKHGAILLDLASLVDVFTRPTREERERLLGAAKKFKGVNL